ncbi:hypothetical protein [Flavobacterium arcticum]|nr:hypothetical protein [Flavobacterium arcticum]
MDGSFWDIEIPTGSILTGTFAGPSNYETPLVAPLFGIKHEVV